MRITRGGAVARTVAAGAAVLGLLAGAISGPVSAGMLQAVVPNYPVKNLPPGPAQPWNVGDTFVGTIGLANFATAPNDVNPINVTTLLFTPSCGASSGNDGICDTVPDALDPGVMGITNAVGAAGTACDGVVFTIGVFDAASGELSFTPQTPFSLGPSNLSGGPVVCAITFDVEVLKAVTKVHIGANGPGTLGLARAEFADSETGDTGISNGSTDAWLIAPVLTISKAPIGAVINAGQNAVFTITVGNNGAGATGPATNIVITDALPAAIPQANWTITPPVPGCSIVAGPALNCTLPGPLAVGATQQIVLTGSTAGVACPATFNNIANITGFNDQIRITPLASNQADISCQVVTSTLTATKTDGVSTYTPGSQVVYTIVVGNPAGPSPAPGSIVSDTKPAQISSWSWVCNPAATGGASGCTGSGGAVSTDFTDTVDLPIGSTISYTVTANIASDATGNLVNTVTVTPPNGTPGTQTDTDTPAPVTNLVTTKTDNVDSVGFGASTVYVVVVTNVGPSDSVGAILVDPLVTGLTKTAVACAAGACVTPPTIAELESGTFVLPTIVAGGNYVFTVTATVTSLTGSVTNAASVRPPPGTTSTGAGCVSSSNINRVFTAADGTCTSSDTDAVVYLTYGVQKVASSNNLAPGSPLTFAITVTNNGPAPADGTIITDILPAGFTPISALCTSGPSCPPGDLLATLGTGVTVTPFPAGTSYVFTVQGTFTLPTGSLTNTATACPPSPLAGLVACQTGSTTVNVPLTAIPTLSEYALIALMLLLAGVGGIAARRTRR